ncbi:metallophosphoesterase [Paraglaciecola arctica]|uniref:metallophosphoesterase n=1 Tax=Paraglaciecola arctica TaxID=1128911 RepID=UPI001C06B1A6|nr:metallophosphoesterase [Paraglaciecola arctica]
MRLINFLLVIACISTSVSHATSVHDQAYYQAHQIHGLSVPEESLNFLVIGDWGRNGHYQQKTVADMMDVAMWQLDAEFIATTGDNFYSNGVASVDDPYWKSSFEDIYHGPHLFENWYPTLGNHDYRGNWQAQIEYSNLSRRWEFPNNYYAKNFVLADQEELLILFIDTSPLNPGYKNVAKYAESQKQDGAKQLAWIEQKLQSSNAKWKIIVGHHPLYTSGKRYGKTADIRGVLEPIFEKNKVDAYFAGHEHDLQHNQPKGTTVQHFVSGAGSELRKVAQRSFTRFAEATAGIASVSVSSNELLVQFISGANKVLYQYSIHKD